MSRIAGAEAKRLEKLTTDFLSYARPGSAPFQQIDSTALVGYIVSIVQPQALQKDLQIEVEMCDAGGISSGRSRSAEARMGKTFRR